MAVSMMMRRSGGTMPSSSVIRRTQIGVSGSRRNAYNQTPNDSKAGDPNDLLAAGGRWTFIMGVARVRGFVIASVGERIETTTVVTSGSTTWAPTTKYTKQELIDYVDANDISFSIPNIWETDPYNKVALSIDPDGTGALERELNEGFVVVHPDGSYVVARAWDTDGGGSTTETISETRHAQVLMGFAIPVTPDADLEIYGVVDPSSGLLVADYVSDAPFTLSGFDVAGHAGKSDQQPPDILYEIGEPE